MTQADVPVLRANSIGPWGLAALAIGITSPAMGLYALWAPMQAQAGPITPLIFIAAMLMTLPTALSYAVINRRMPSSGSVATWLWESAGPAFGHGAGLAMVTYFLMATIAQPLMFALFFRDLLSWLHVGVPDTPCLVLGIFCSVLPVALAGFRGAEASIRTTVILMIFETAVVLFLSGSILFARAAQAGGISFAPWNPAHASNGLDGFSAALTLGVLAFCGFDVVSTAAEETGAPKEHLPKAILLTVVGMALFWAVNAWVFTLSASPAAVEHFNAQGLTAVTPIADRYIGNGAVLVIVTALTGLTAVTVSCMQGTSRLLFVLARAKLLPSALARLSGDKSIPRVAVGAVLVLTVVVDLFSLVIAPNALDAFTFWANGLVFFAILTFTGVNIACILLFKKERRGLRKVIVYLALPLAGISVNLWLLCTAFLSVLWSDATPVGGWTATTCIVIFVIELLCVLGMTGRRSTSIAANLNCPID